MSGMTKFLLGVAVAAALGVTALGLYGVLKKDIPKPKPEEKAAPKIPAAIPPRPKPPTPDRPGPTIIPARPTVAPDRPPAPSTLSSIIFAQERGEGSIRGTVRDVDNIAIDGAAITISLGPVPAPSERGPQTATTANGGAYEFKNLAELPEKSKYVVRCKAPFTPKGATTPNVAKDVVEVGLAYGESKVVNFTLRTRGDFTVEGELTAGSGGIGGIDLTLWSEHFEGHARTGADGKYRILEVPAGDYVVRATYRDASGSQTDVASLPYSVKSSTYLSSNQLVNGSLAAVKLSLKDETGKPVPAGRAIELLRPDPADARVSTSVASGKTNAAGEVEFKYVPQGQYVLSVPGFKPEPATLSVYGDVGQGVTCVIPKSTRPDR